MRKVRLIWDEDIMEKESIEVRLSDMVEDLEDIKKDIKSELSEHEEYVKEVDDIQKRVRTLRKDVDNSDNDGVGLHEYMEYMREEWYGDDE